MHQITYSHFHITRSLLYEMTFETDLCTGLALMQNQNESPRSYEECREAPKDQIQEAADLHKFAEAAYTVL